MAPLRWTGLTNCPINSGRRHQRQMRFYHGFSGLFTATVPFMAAYGTLCKMKADFIVTAMYFGAAFIAPAMISGRVMIWLFGIWILGILLAPFDKERTLLKKITEYGAIIALGII